jgi:hypothetical protein
MSEENLEQQAEVTELDDETLEDVSGGLPSALDSAANNCDCTNTGC